MGRAGRLAVRLTNTTKSFDSGIVALEKITVDIPQGEFVTVVGPSGCGKSTLLRLLAGLLPPSSGTVEVFGEAVAKPRRDIALMQQQPALLDWRTSYENVLLPHEIGESMSDERRQQAMDLLAMLGLTGFEHTYPPHLSGGMQQRVALARLLITDADMLLLDEPFGALDEFTRERLNVELMRIFERYQQTVLLVTHNITEAVLMADRVLVLTPSPGRLGDVLTVDLPRPRNIEIIRTPEFNDLVFKARGVLEDHIS